MYKLRNLIGMPVICQSRKIGRLVQADLSEDLKQLNGIWIDRGLLGTRYIASEQLEMIGSIAVMADDPGKKKRFSAYSPVIRAVTTDGSRIGAIVGAEIDEISFMVNALELSRGFWDDLYGRRCRVERYTVCPDRGEVIVMSSTSEYDKEDP